MASLNYASLLSPIAVAPTMKFASSARRPSASGIFKRGNILRVSSSLEKERSDRVILHPDDGSGPESMKVAVDVMRAVGGREGMKFDFTEKLAGGVAIDDVGVPLHEDTLDACRGSDAVLPAAIGGFTEDDNNEQGDDEQEDDYPLWMEEDDPTWPEGEDEGYGFQVSQFFEKWGTPKVKNVDEDGKVTENEGETDDEDEGLDLKWEGEEEQWIVREINFLEWDLVALQDPTPLIVLGFERYGSSGANGWTLLKELEIMLKRIIDSRKYPVRAVKLDVNVEQDLAASLKMKAVPTLLFIKAGKMVYRMTGVKSADELLLITSHLFYHSTRPACMDDEKIAESVTNMR